MQSSFCILLVLEFGGGFALTCAVGIIQPLRCCADRMSTMLPRPLG